MDGNALRVESTLEPAGLTGPPGQEHTRQVVERYQAMVYGIALTHTQCQGDADDVFQEVFLAYHRRTPQCADEEHRKAWLIVTTLNCARKLAASSWRTRVVPLSPSDAERTGPVQFHFATEQQDAVFRALAHLAEPYRTVLHLFYFEDLPVGRIAELLELEPGTVRVRLTRGRQQMRDQLLGALFDD
ncbi:MAG: sigma-70 family RNA polymerase sigma factor [Bifidobacteriaceae bacterium]|jgi:RNA polymerase sigma-70 factor (ECF subfamily)|nr:sigma-70 family RNA polymerase sigma factor [Bifidobacteriaceae bacterium]